MNSYYFDIKCYPRKPGCKTDFYIITARKDQSTLGMGKWFSRWRQYCFFPANDTIWSDECLRDIYKFVAGLNNEHNKGRYAAESDYSKSTF